MISKISITVTDEEQDFFRMHPEINRSKFVRMAVREYKKRLGEPLYNDDEDEEVKA